MSARRIGLGVLIGICSLAAGFVGSWYLNFSPEVVPIVLLATVMVATGLLPEVLARRALMKKYWNRPCSGFFWRREFPNSSKTEIRQFLDLFVQAFGFSRRRRLCFLPTDKVMEVFHTINPPGWADAMELESLCKEMKKKYQLDLAPVWKEDLTLGEIFSRATILAI